MPRYLVEVSQPDRVAAERIIDAVRTWGSHFATHADWRQTDGICTGTLILEADDRGQALAVVPPNMRSNAHVFRLEPVASNIKPSTLPHEPLHSYAAAA